MVYVLCRPKLWRFFIAFQCEYFFRSPYFVAERYHTAEQSWIYGYTSLLTIHRILSYIFPQGARMKTLCDLGCGDGRVVFVAGLVWNMFAKGVDQNPLFIEKALMINHYIGCTKVQFEVANILDADLIPYDVVYLAWTTFPKHFEMDITRKLVHEMRENTWVICLSFPVDHTAFVVRFQQKFYFSWGRNMVYFCQKII